MVSERQSPVNDAAVCLAIVGATGTGKSLLADALAAYLGGELISADSMQVYRGMDVGTAKTPPDERSVLYHCIDLVEPDQPFTAALYQRAARRVIEELLARGVTPVLCGGTGLYLRAALDDFCFDEGRDDEGLRERAAGEGAADERGAAEGAAAEGAAGEGGTCDGGLAPDGGGDGRDGAASERRARLQAQAEELGADAFHALFAARDPESAELIHPHNIRRVIRAFEIFEQGGSYARQREGFGRFEPVYPARLIGLAVEPEVLYEVIERRVDSMIASGLLEEVQRLLDEGFREAICARQAIGYKELVPVLAGECALEEAVARIKQATRRYAKRQRTWFKRDERIEWLDVTDLHRARLAGRLDAHAFAQALLARTLPIL